MLLIIVCHVMPEVCLIELIKKSSINTNSIIAHVMLLLYVFGVQETPVFFVK